MADASEVGIKHPMTVGGVQMSAQDLGKMVSDAKTAAANGDADGKLAEGAQGTDAGKDGGAAAGTAADAAKPKTGKLMLDGKPVKDGDFMPRDRYNEEMRTRRERAKAAGIDFDTFQPLAKSAQNDQSRASGAAAAGTGAEAPKAPEKGKEPWLGKLLAMPTADDVDEKGQPRYATNADLVEARAEAKAYNRMVAAQGLEAWQAEQQRQAQQEEQAKTEDQQRIHTFQSDMIPAALEKWGVTREEFDAKIGNLTKIPANEARDTFIYNFALKHAKNGAELLMALGDEAATAEGVAYLTKVAGMSQNELINELVGMDRLVQLGFTVQGKPRPAGKNANGAGGAKDLKNANGGSTTNHEASPTIGKNGAVVEPNQMTGDAYLKKRKADQLAAARETAKKFPGAVVRES